MKYLYLIAVLIAVVLFLLPISLLTFWLPLRLRPRFFSPFWKAFGFFVLNGLGRMKIHSEDHRSPEYKKIPLKGLYIANHLSLADIPLICTQVQIAPIMKKEVLYIPILGFCAWATGSINVDRKNQHSRIQTYNKSTERLSLPLALQYYPEGTRSKNGSPKNYSEIKTRLMEYAYKENIAVIPMSLCNTEQIFSRGAINTGLQLGIIVHQEVLPSDFHSEESFMTYCWDKVISGHENLKKNLI